MAADLVPDEGRPMPLRRGVDQSRTFRVTPLLARLGSDRTEPGCGWTGVDRSAGWQLAKIALVDSNGLPASMHPINGYHWASFWDARPPHA
jgi:hypothetical protein